MTEKKAGRESDRRMDDKQLNDLEVWADKLGDLNPAMAAKVRVLLEEIYALQTPQRIAPRPATPKPSPTRWRHAPLFCHACERDVLAEQPIVAKVEIGKSEGGAIVWVQWGHKQCHLRRGDAWEDLADLTNPHLYIDWWMTLMNGLQTGVEPVGAVAYESVKTLLLALAPFVFRPMAATDKARLAELAQVPRWAGGLG